jgi:phosphomevalonate kinase
VIASAPGKLILTGEYAVLDGAPAIVVAVDRRATACRVDARRATSPFLLAVADEVAARRGAAAAQAALEISVDSAAFYDGSVKLGIGSSAAVTVAATALALGGAPRDEILEVALAAHARAQAQRGAAGSGADIAASVLGGTVVFSRSGGAVPWRTELRSWPDAVALVPFFTGTAADTPQLVSRVQAARMARRAAVEAALAAIDETSRAACAALVGAPGAPGLIDALSRAGDALARLAAVTDIDLVPACVTAARGALARLGGTAKTTGAGGGDIGIAVVPATADSVTVTALLVAAGCQPLALARDDRGVTVTPAASAPRGSRVS